MYRLILKELLMFVLNMKKTIKFFKGIGSMGG